MLPYKANFINGLVLIIVGIFGYISMRNNDAANFSPTVFIAPLSGMLFLLLTPFMKKENKIISHLVVLFTFLLGSMLLVMFIKRVSTGSSLSDLSMLRFLVMIISCFVAMTTFVSSFRNAERE